MVKVIQHGVIGVHATAREVGIRWNAFSWVDFASKSNEKFNSLCILNIDDIQRGSNIDLTIFKFTVYDLYFFKIEKNWFELLTFEF